MDYINMPFDFGDLAYLTHNPCWPHTLQAAQIAGPGYALLHRDQYYRNHATEDANLYAIPPDSFDTRGITPPSKRSLFEAPPDFAEEDGTIMVREINSTRLPTADEMQTWLGYVKCKYADCKLEIEENKIRLADIQSEMVALSPIPRATASPLILTKAYGNGKVATATFQDTVATGSGNAGPAERVKPVSPRETQPSSSKDSSHDEGKAHAKREAHIHRHQKHGA
jgi:hypothetical protein